MAEKTSPPRKGLTAAPKTIRAEMAKTRAALEKKLGELKSRFSIADPASEKRIPTMATKKSSRGAAAKKKPAAKKSQAVQAVKKTAGVYAKKAKKVLGEMLTGAAVGAVQGAADAVASDKKKKTKSK